MIQHSCFALICAVVLRAGCTLIDSTEQPEFSVHEATDPLIESFLREMVRDEHFSGVALVMQDGRITHAKGYGAATRVKANDVNTAYHVASITNRSEKS